MAETKVSEELWQEFHRVVNMTSRELADWMRVQSADQDTEELPDQAGRSLGQRVLAILGKRAADVTDDDIAAMEKVVATVRRERGEEPEPKAGDDHWRHRLMAIGHDPLKPV
jgi:hypothetical protein